MEIETYPEVTHPGSVFTASACAISLVMGTGLGMGMGTMDYYCTVHTALRQPQEPNPCLLLRWSPSPIPFLAPPPSVQCERAIRRKYK